MTLPNNSIPIGKGYSTSQWETWFGGFDKANPKMTTYTGTNASGKGKTWQQLYPVLYQSGQSAASKQGNGGKGLSPDQVAEAEIILIQTQAVATGIGTAVQWTGWYSTAAPQAAAAGAEKAGSSIPGVAAISSVEGFLSALGNLNLWIRVAKVAIGGVILVVGVAKLTHLDQKATGIAKTALKVAPFV